MAGGWDPDPEAYEHGYTCPRLTELHADALTILDPPFRRRDRARPL